MKEGYQESANGRITLVNNIVIHQSKSSDDDDDYSPLGSLDAVLEKARKRQGINFQYKLQAIWESPLIRLDRPYAAVGLEYSFIFTKGDAALTAVAFFIHAKGFAFGYIFGKLSMGPLRELLQPSPSVQLLLMPLWTVFWAILFDQIFA